MVYLITFNAPHPASEEILPHRQAGSAVPQFLKVFQMAPFFAKCLPAALTITVLERD
jgi:hypothetical protein